MLTKDMGNLDFTQDAVVLERLIRGLNPWPSAFTKLGDKTLKVYEASVLTEEEANALNSDVAGSGSIIAVDKKSFTVRCGNGALRIMNLQLEGKKRMDTAAFLLGYKIEVGGMLG